MSLGESDAKFPNQSSSAQGPPPSRENPGGVYPKSSPTAAKPQEIPGSGGASDEPRSVLSNPFEFQDELNQLGSALDRVIAAIDAEGGGSTSEMSARQGRTGNIVDQQPGSAGFHLRLRKKFEQWKMEVAELAYTGDRGVRAERSDGTKTVPDVATTTSTSSSGGNDEGGLFND